MLIKGKKNLKDYKYLVMFDLASITTGVCLWDIGNNRPLQTQIIKVKENCESKVYELSKELESYFNSLKEKGINLQDVLVYKEAMPTQLHGGSSTIQTFVALAKSHAVLTLYLMKQNIDLYDDVGVYPASTHSYFRHLSGLTLKDKVDKKAIREYVVKEYGLSGLSLDESDAVFLAKTFVDVKWNKDIDDSIREIKRHKKTLKAPHAIKECDEEISRLILLKI